MCYVEMTVGEDDGHPFHARFNSITPQPFNYSHKSIRATRSSHHPAVSVLSSSILISCSTPHENSTHQQITGAQNPASYTPRNSPTHSLPRELGRGETQQDARCRCPSTPRTCSQLRPEVFAVVPFPAACFNDAQLRATPAGRLPAIIFMHSIS